MATCADNSTECLLQHIVAILESTNNAYSWDPVTFGFTVGIGAIALWFAIVPILQGLFFPPERLKYDETAIGKWSTLSKKKWDWGTLRFEVLTRTPFLDVAEIVQWGRDQPPSSLSPAWKPKRHTRRNAEPDIENGAELGLNKLATNRPSQSRSLSSHSPNAGWLSLLQTLEIEQLVFGNGRTKATSVAMIPSDVPAAVAYGSIESLVLLAAVAGCRNLLMDGKYPVCQASGLQLDFRSHPSLGTVGAFTRYGFESMYNTTTPEHLKVAYAHSQGILQYRGVDIETTLLKMNPVIRARGAFGPIIHPEHVRTDLEDNGLNLTEGIWLLIGDVPTEVRVFPSMNLQVHAVASAIAAQDSWWLASSGIPDPMTSFGWLVDNFLPGAAYNQRIHGFHGKAHYPDHVNQSSKIQFHSWLSEKCYDRRPQWPTAITTSMRYSDTMIILDDAIKICKAWLRDPSDFKSDMASTCHYRETIIVQLFEIDYWLHKSRIQANTLRITRNLFHRASAFLRIAQKFSDLPQEPSPPRASIWNQSSIRENGNQVIQEIRNAFTRGSKRDWETNLKFNRNLADSGDLFYLAFEATLGVHVEAISHGLKLFRPEEKVDTENPASTQAEAEMSDDIRTNDDTKDNIDDNVDGNHATLELPLIDPAAPVVLQGQRRQEREYAHFLEKEEAIRAEESNYMNEEEQKQFQQAVEKSLDVGLRGRPGEVSQSSREASLMFYLVFRAVLYGALLGTGADNTCVLESQTSQQIVPVI